MSVVVMSVMTCRQREECNVSDEPLATSDLSGVTILQVIPELNGGGAETTTLEITEALVASGARALIASVGGRLEERLALIGGEMVHLPVASKNPIVMVMNSFRLANLIRREKIDIIHARSRAPAWSSFFAARFANISYLATYHGLVHAQPKIKVFYNSVLTRGRAVIANSAYTAELIEQVHKVPKDFVRVIPRGCEPEKLDPSQWSAEQVTQTRGRWGVKDYDFVIICPARLTEIKGQDILIKALAALNNEKKPVLVLAGGAKARDSYALRLADLVEKLGLQDRVIFAGHIDNMPLAYAASQLAVLPSTRAEPFGRTIIEAGAAGLPVIASDDGGFRETVISGEDKKVITGWLVPPGDSLALTHCLDRVLSFSTSDLRKIGENGRRHVSSTFTRAQMCRHTLGVYKDLMKR